MFLYHFHSLSIATTLHYNMVQNSGEVKPYNDIWSEARYPLVSFICELLLNFLREMAGQASIKYLQQMTFWDSCRRFGMAKPLVLNLQ